MARGHRPPEQASGRARPKGWLFSRVAEVLVVVLLLSGAAIYYFDLGDRWLGGADPRTEPAEVAPPEGLDLPVAQAAGRVARKAHPGTSDPAQVAARIEPMLRRGILGRRVAVMVTDLASGDELFRVGPRTVTPASTVKVLTTAAALEALGPMTRFRTSVRWLPRRKLLVVVGGGDPFLASGPRQATGGYPHRADLRTLAEQAVGELRDRGVRRARVAYDDSYFTGPAVNPEWPDSYLPEGVVPPISSLWVEQGRSPTGYGFVDDPAARAGSVFRDAVRSAGMRVRGPAEQVVTPRQADEVATVRSAPLGEIVERTLAVSDNQAAEVLARHVGLAERQEGSFTAGTSAVLDVMRRIGVGVRGDQLHDGSGLSRENRIAPETLAGVLRVAASGAHPELRPVITGLPVAGFTGSLQYRFDRGPDEARGRVRAKTGTLTGVHGLAGVADDVSGGRMAFVVVADRVAVPKTLAAQLLIDRMAAALGACRCGVGSSP